MDKIFHKFLSHSVLLGMLEICCRPWVMLNLYCILFQENIFVAAVSQQNQKDLIWVHCCRNILPYCEQQKST